MEQVKFSFLISTKNRCEDVLLTLHKIEHLLSPDVNCVVFDDGSTDDTSEKIKQNFPEVILLRNEKSKGYIYCRNKMLNETKADFAISLDDDAHFLTEKPIEIITDYFQSNPNSGLIAARIFWGKDTIENTNSSETIQTVKSYIGCGHIWRMKAWRDIPNYPEWFEFYGEENFASLQLFKKKWEVHYVPQLLVQHRVDMGERAKSASNIAFRYRRAIRADWYTFFMFFPWRKIPRKMAYSLWMQFRNKIFKGNFKVAKPLVLAIWDLFVAVPKLVANRNALTLEEYNEYLKLNEAKIYWKPEK
ncbi:glycosyltransferase family 2 protein [Flavobacterium wongokense]|uniref:glycosyltransferase family 2 protein n=1 Tax=Flavobacterium wongokense TaxID=2910674 RepID=UPI001F40C34C|nr:glycosyltransferase [Flavobacterium sp. WG47]MCF6132675.1 glycosyltransferase [Flavobacterium sp. WG47]